MWPTNHQSYYGCVSHSVYKNANVINSVRPVFTFIIIISCSKFRFCFTITRSFFAHSQHIYRNTFEWWSLPFRFQIHVLISCLVCAPARNVMPSILLHFSFLLVVFKLDLKFKFRVCMYIYIHILYIHIYIYILYIYMYTYKYIYIICIYIFETFSDLSKITKKV